MTTQAVMKQRMIRLYKDETGEKEVDMHKVAEFAVRKGWRLPVPPKPIDMLARQFTDAAREEIRKDDVTGQPYRANHAIVLPVQGGGQMSLWVDIDEAPRHRMKMSLTQRREQMVGDGLQLSLDADHWNRIHPNEEPIQVPLDFTDDVEWRKNGPGEEEAA